MFKKIFYLICVFLVGCATQNPSAVNYPEAAKINSELGLGYLQENNLVRAKEKLLLAQQESPNSVDVLQAFAYFYQQTKESQLAQIYYEKALRVAPNNPSVLNNYGVFLCDQGQYNMALAYFEKAASQMSNLNPAKAYTNAGWCALKIPDKTRAASYFQKAYIQ